MRELIDIATEALGRYRLRTALSVLGIVLGVAAVIAMTSVSEGAAREALAQVEALGLDNLVARSRSNAAAAGSWHGLVAGDADRVALLVPMMQATSALIERTLPLSYGPRVERALVLGVRPSYQTILALSLAEGRFLSPTDEQTTAPTCVLGATLARQLFGYRSPIGESLRIGQNYYRVVGVLREQGVDPKAGTTIAWRDVNRVAFVPLETLSGHPLAVEPNQPADEIWVRIEDGSRVDAMAGAFAQALSAGRRRPQFDIVVPRELLAQRYRTQQTFSVVVGSVAVLALLIGGIGIMNIMLTSVVERTREIGVRRTAGATRRDITWQFLAEALLMTVGGGIVGIIVGAVASLGISAYADWRTHVSPAAVVLGFLVSLAVGVVFGLYPAMKAAALEPVDAMRHE